MSQADQKPDFTGYRNNIDDGINVIFVPDGATYETEKPRFLSPDVYMHVANIQNKINMDFPGILRGAQMGGSGRQDDRASGAAKSIYDSIKENNDILWADAISLGIRMCEKLDILPKGIHKGDIARVAELTVDLGKKDPIEQSRKTAEGMNLWERGAIDQKTFLMEYNGKTEDQADTIIAQARVDLIMKNSPTIMQILEQSVIQELGVETEQQAGEATQALNPTTNFGSQGGEPRNANIQSPLGREMADTATPHESRLPPRR